ncbi:hypothetical protein CBL_20248, partial [Carabus blaptoides fortunei]
MNLPPSTSKNTPERRKHHQTPREPIFRVSSRESNGRDNSAKRGRRQKRSRREYRSRKSSSSSHSSNGSTDYHSQRARWSEHGAVPKQVLELASIVKDLATITKNKVEEFPSSNFAQTVSAHVFRGDAIPVFTAEDPEQKIRGRDAVSCIIGGLADEHLQQIARAGDYRDPEALFEYLRTCRDPQPPRTWHSQNRDRKRKYPGPNTHQKYNPQKGKQPIRCFRCNAPGHMASRCTLNPSRLGRQEKDNDEKSKEARTTFGCVAIRNSEAEARGLTIVHKRKVIRGYGNGRVETLGSTTFTLKVDEAEADVEADVVPDDIQSIPILIGQPFTESPRVSVFKDNKYLRIQNVSQEPEMKELQKAPDTTTLWVKEATVIPPNYLGYVAVEGAKNFAGDVYISGKIREYGDQLTCTPGAVLHLEPGDRTLLPVVNMSDRNFTAVKHRVIAEGIRCAPEHTNLTNETEVLRIESENLPPLQTDDIITGPISDTDRRMLL